MSTEGINAVADLAERILPETNQYGFVFRTTDRLKDFILDAKQEILSGNIDSSETGGILVTKDCWGDGEDDFQIRVFADLGTL